MPRGHPNLRRLAEIQRWLIWLVLVALVALFVEVWISSVRMTNLFADMARVVRIFLSWVFAVVAILAGWAMRENPIVFVINGLVMFVPGINILALLSVSSTINKTFRKAGVRVGVLGVKPVDLAPALDPTVCPGCAYNLTGNVSGICRECGRPIANPKSSL